MANAYSPTRSLVPNLASADSVSQVETAAVPFPTSDHVAAPRRRPVAVSATPREGPCPRATKRWFDAARRQPFDLFPSSENRRVRAN